jgi:hypothetical protein
MGVMRRWIAWYFLALLACGSAPPRDAASALDKVELLDAQRPAQPLRAILDEAPFTAIVFFSAHCACQSAHDARLRALIERFRARVRFVLVDSEVDATPELEAAEAARRGYTAPPMIDRGAALARALGAEAATYAVVLDRLGRVHYAGGIDSDRVHLTSDATPYLADALEDLLAGRVPRVRISKALGCALRTS